MTTTEKKTFKLQIWQVILVPIILALIPLLYPEIKAAFVRKQPQFIIENPIVSKGDSILHIFAENQPAKKNEVEGLEFKDAGKLVKTNPLEWEFNLLKYEIPETLFTEGLNKLRIGFPSSVGYDELNIYVRANFFQNVAVEDLSKLKDTSSIKGVLNNQNNYFKSVVGVQVVSALMDDDSRVGVAESRLRGLVGDTKVIGYPNKSHDKNINTSEVRYFTEADKPIADSIAKTLLKELNIQAKSVHAGTTMNSKIVAKQSGQFEVILSKD
jgi:hypothetical protein